MSVVKWTMKKKIIRDGGLKTVFEEAERGLCDLNRVGKSWSEPRKAFIRD